jgi:peptide-methionine (R)-S-oxide reductase
MFGMVLTVITVAAAQEPLAQAEKSSQDPFDVAAKAVSGASDKDTTGSSGKSPETTDKADTKTAEKKKAEPEPEFVRKSFEEWRRILPRDVFSVTRLKATEAAFTGKYATGHFHGTFVCACCEGPLFSSQHKFDSGTGWPSFWQPIKAAAIDRAPDYNEAEPRVEVMCHRCGAHLGHVFDDGPPPTGLRFCINSLSLKLRSTEGDAARPAATKARAKSKVKTTRATRSRSGTRSSRGRGAAKPGAPDAADPGEPETAASAPAGAGKPGGA